MTNYIGYRDGGKTNEQGLFQWMLKLFRVGVPTVNSSTSWQVTQRGAGANMSVDIATGDGQIGISTSLYTYWGFSDAINNKSVTAADPSNPRRDIVVAYVDLSVVDSTSNNNPGALKFAVVAGTPAGSPSDPSDPTIQSAVGASNPWTKLARISVAAAASSVVNANITDLRTPIAVQANLWGGSSNTAGHAVPNVADDTVALLAAAQNFTNKSLDSSNTFTAPRFRSIDAWIDANETWTYASASTITVPTDATTKYDVGDYIKMTQSATVKYFVVVSLTSTVLTVTGLAGVTVANSAITANYYSKARTPHGAAVGGLPFNPYKFSAYLNGAQNSINGSVLVNLDTKNFDTSTNFNTSTHLFTAPIAGFYYFTGLVSCGPSSSVQAALIKNGTAIKFGTFSAARTFSQSIASDLIQLAATDTVGLNIVTDGIYAIQQLASTTYLSGFLVSAI